MNNSFFNRLMAVAAFIGAFGVMFGAFGAHYLKSRLPDQNLETIKTGVLYLFIHVLAALVTGMLGNMTPLPWLRRAGIAFIAGIFMYSGSLFIIATAPITGFPVASIGWITPVGGLSFILGWVALAMSRQN